VEKVSVSWREHSMNTRAMSSKIAHMSLSRHMSDFA
jgi:hypothetical protein